MTYKIMLVEDEPPSMRSMKRCLQLTGLDFEVSCEAYNGLEALERIAAEQPDVVLTDIRMPGMDGIELVERLEASFPRIRKVIVSGHQEFRYAQRAIQMNVSEYLLKPLKEEPLREVLQRIESGLDDERRQSELRLLQSAMRGGPADGIERISSRYPYLSVFVINVGPYPLRYVSRERQVTAPSEDLLRYFGRFLGQHEKAWLLEGKYPNQAIVVHGSSAPSAEKMAYIGNSLASAGLCGCRSMTAACAPDITDVGQLGVQANRLYTLVHQHASYGESRFVQGPVDARHSSPPLPDDAELVFVNAMRHKNIPQFLQHVDTWLQEGSRRQYPQRWAESFAHQLLSAIRKHARTAAPSAFEPIELAMEELLSTCDTMEELSSGFRQLLHPLLAHEEEGAPPDKYGRQLAEEIKAYIREFSHEPLEMKTLSAKFGISSTYLCTLFKKHTDLSPVEFMTSVRMDKAKKLIVRNPDLLIKDVAEAIGYTDHHYFSKAFKAYFGLSPTEYRQQP